MLRAEDPDGMPGGGWGCLLFSHWDCLSNDLLPPHPPEYVCIYIYIVIDIDDDRSNISYNIEYLIHTYL